MMLVSVVSRRRAGIARLVTATASPIHTDESRVNIMFGSGSMTKSTPRISRWRRLREAPNSSLVTPSMSTAVSRSGSRSARYEASSPPRAWPSRGSAATEAMTSSRASGR